MKAFSKLFKNLDHHDWSSMPMGVYVAELYTTNVCCRKPRCSYAGNTLAITYSDSEADYSKANFKDTQLPKLLKSQFQTLNSQASKILNSQPYRYSIANLIDTQQPIPKILNSQSYRYSIANCIDCQNATCFIMIMTIKTFFITSSETFHYNNPFQILLLKKLPRKNDCH